MRHISSAASGGMLPVTPVEGGSGSPGRFATHHQHATCQTITPMVALRHAARSPPLFIHSGESRKSKFSPGRAFSRQAFTFSAENTSCEHSAICERSNGVLHSADEFMAGPAVRVRTVIPWAVMPRSSNKCFPFTRTSFAPVACTQTSRDHRPPNQAQNIRRLRVGSLQKAYLHGTTWGFSNTSAPLSALPVAVPPTCSRSGDRVAGHAVTKTAPALDRLHQKEAKIAAKVSPRQPARPASGRDSSKHPVSKHPVSPLP